jgi:hypothetical protein
VQYSVSSETISAICNVFANTPQQADGAGSGDSESFATLARTFINTLAGGSPSDLGREWLLHRLHSVLVTHERPIPGEIEVMRADLRARVESSHFSSAESELIIRGIENNLTTVYRPRSA